MHVFEFTHVLSQWCGRWKRIFRCMFEQLVNIYEDYSIKAAFYIKLSNWPTLAVEMDPLTIALFLSQILRIASTFSRLTVSGRSLIARHSRTCEFAQLNVVTCGYSYRG